MNPFTSTLRRISGPGQGAILVPALVLALVLALGLTISRPAHSYINDIRPDPIYAGDTVTVQVMVIGGSCAYFVDEWEVTVDGQQIFLDYLLGWFPGPDCPMPLFAGFPLGSFSAGDYELTVTGTLPPDHPPHNPLGPWTTTFTVIPAAFGPPQNVPTLGVWGLALLILAVLLLGLTTHRRRQT